MTLRKLIEEVKKTNFVTDKYRQAQDATYKFMNVMAGNLPNFEEALRLLYAKDRKGFISRIDSWPKDIQDHILEISKAAF